MKVVFLALLMVAMGGCKGKSSIWLTPSADMSSPTVPSPVPGDPSLKVVANNPALLDGPSQQTFQIGTIRELLVRLTLPAAPAPTVFVTLSLVDPHGGVFSTRSLAFSTNPALKQVAVPSAPDVMMDVDQVKTVPDGVALDSYFLVGGTALQNKGSAGVWRIRAEVDGYPDLKRERAVDFGMTL